MADEERAPEPAPETPGSRGKLIVIGIVAIVALGAGLGISMFIVLPMLRGDQPEENELDDAIPVSAVPFDFPEAQATVLPDGPEMPAPVLLYTVSMMCANEKTRLLIENNQQWFVAMLSELHSDKARAEMTSPPMKKGLLRQAMKEANTLLRRLQEKPDPDIHVIEVLYLKCAIFDL